MAQSKNISGQFIPFLPDNNDFVIN